MHTVHAHLRAKTTFIMSFPYPRFFTPTVVRLVTVAYRYIVSVDNLLCMIIDMSIAAYFCFPF